MFTEKQVIRIVGISCATTLIMTSTVWVLAANLYGWWA